jgi:8-amino-7-oxononanoate synthase
MGSVMAEEHQKILDDLAAKHRLRALAPRAGLDFTSNDFLGLAESQALKDAVRAALDRSVPAGAGGSRLLRGNHPEHELLEEEAAKFFHAESALYFSTGFAANAALAATLPRREDLFIHDELIHASIRDGMGKAGVPVGGTAHNDLNAMEQLIKHWRTQGGKGQVWIAVETLYSMDGDKAPLNELVALAKQHDAMLLLDESHATGVYGPQGRGLAHAYEGQANIICLHTCGKALGAQGGLITLPRHLRDFMINRARAFIYSTAPSPLMAAAVRAALKLVAAADDQRDKLHELVALLDDSLEKQLKIVPSGTPIQPIVLGSDERALKVAGRLQEQGFDVRAIRPPTVPEGTARLRISVTLHADAGAIDRLVEALASVMEPA